MRIHLGKRSHVNNHGRRGVFAPLPRSPSEAGPCPAAAGGGGTCKPLCLLPSLPLCDSALDKRRPLCPGNAAWGARAPLSQLSPYCRLPRRVPCHAPASPAPRRTCQSLQPRLLEPHRCSTTHRPAAPPHYQQPAVPEGSPAFQRRHSQPPTMAPVNCFQPHSASKGPAHSGLCAHCGSGCCSFSR